MGGGARRADARCSASRSTSASTTALLDYQPGWLALPLGLVELGLIVLAMRMPVTWSALGLFALGWATAQLCGHVLFPRFHLEYAQGGGELPRAGALVAASVAAVTLAGVAGAVAVIPPTVHLHGVVRGPLVIDHAQTLVGGTVRGGIVISASHVTLKDVTVIGGENGIDVENAEHVMLDGVRILGVTLDGIHVRRGSVMVKDCQSRRRTARGCRASTSRSRWTRRCR